MNADELKQKLKGIFGEQIVFNREFNKYAGTIKNVDENFLEWCKLVKENKVQSYPAPRLKKSMVFIKKIGSLSRCIVIKVFNGKVKEVHLGDHRYYDYLRMKLGLKKNRKTF